MRRESQKGNRKPYTAKDDFIIKTDDGEYMVEKGDSFYVYSGDEETERPSRSRRSRERSRSKSMSRRSSRRRR